MLFRSSAETGLADDQPDTDTFYGWGGLMPMLGVAELIDVTPWHGWEITHRSGDWSLGPLIAFGKTARLQAKDGWLSLELEGREIVRTSVPGRLRQIAFTANSFSCRLPDLLPAGAEIILPQVAVSAVKTAGFASTDLAPQPAVANSGSAFRLPAVAAGGEFRVAW